MNKSDKTKEDWIDGVMASFAGLRRPEASEYLFQKIEERITRRVILVAETRIVPLRMVSMAAAIIILLISINFFFVTYQFRSDHNIIAMREVASYYGLNSNKSNLIDDL